MGILMDAECPKCGKRLGWSGPRPPCPGCGHTPSREESESDPDEAEINQFMRFLAARGRRRRERERDQERESED